MGPFSPMTPPRPWHASEVILLRRMYPLMRNADLSKHLKRSKDAIETKARMLQLRKAPAFFTKSTSDRAQFLAMQPDKPTQRERDCMVGVRYDLQVRCG